MSSGDPGRGLERPGDGRPTPLVSRSGWRDSIESFVVVFLAFLVWSLEAEGFVIPTGSMAPTLMGRHKEVTCPACGAVFAVNAEREVELDVIGRPLAARVVRGTCQNCRYESDLHDAPSFSGDRIYVMKQGLALPLMGPAGRVQLARWDVAVFKQPEDPEVRFIKRMVGMPGEDVRIRAGDVWVRPSGSTAAFVRPPRSIGHLLGMLVPVYDDRHRPSAFSTDPSWRRWAPVREGDWSESEPGKFEPRPGDSSGGWAELRYRHMVPAPDQWAAIRAGRWPGPGRPTLITDFCSYNTGLTARDCEHPWASMRPWRQPHWVGDLGLSMKLEVRRPVGQFRLELIRGGRSHRCDLDLSTGEVRLSGDGRTIGPPAVTKVHRPGRHDLCFANIDGRLTLVIDQEPVFGDGIGDPTDPGTGPPTADDLEPARMAVRAADLAVSELILGRDLYYTIRPDQSDYLDLEGLDWEDPSALFELLADPSRFARLGSREPIDYPIAPGHYLMLGDNSPRSGDGRAWGRADQVDPAQPGRGWDDSGRASWEVPERLLVGKAFCVYWPHPRPLWPRLCLGPDLRFPVVPDFARMRWIR